MDLVKGKSESQGVERKQQQKGELWFKMTSFDEFERIKADGRDLPQRELSRDASALQATLNGIQAHLTFRQQIHDWLSDYTRDLTVERVRRSGGTECLSHIPIVFAAANAANSIFYLMTENVIMARNVIGKIAGFAATAGVDCQVARNGRSAQMGSVTVQAVRREQFEITEENAAGVPPTPDGIQQSFLLIDTVLPVDTAHVQIPVIRLEFKIELPRVGAPAGALIDDDDDDDDDHGDDNDDDAENYDAYMDREDDHDDEQDQDEH